MAQEAAQLDHLAVNRMRIVERQIARRGVNIGQLCRERFAEVALLIGFGTDRGTVAAASEWDGPMEIKQVRPAHRDSYERFCRESGVARFLVDLRERHSREPLFRCLPAAPVRRLSMV